MKKVVVASVFAAIALFVWGFIYWVPLALALNIYKPAPDEVALAKALEDNLGSADGFYFLPSDMSDEATLKARHAAGPIVTIAYISGGRPMLDPKTFVFGFVHNLISSFLMAMLLVWLAPRLRSYRERVRLVVMASFACAVFGNLGRPIWLVQPWNYHVFQFVYEVTSWLLVALVLGWFINGSEK